jgi:hypothetical protein
VKYKKRDAAWFVQTGSISKRNGCSIVWFNEIGYSFVAEKDFKLGAN